MGRVKIAIGIGEEGIQGTPWWLYEASFTMSILLSCTSAVFFSHCVVVVVHRIRDECHRKVILSRPHCCLVVLHREYEHGGTGHQLRDDGRDKVIAGHCCCCHLVHHRTCVNSTLSTLLHINDLLPRVTVGYLIPPPGHILPFSEKLTSIYYVF